MLERVIHGLASEDTLNRGLQGGFAGLLGGIVFGVWMFENGMLPVIASMAGGTSAALGLSMHLAISLGIGASFGVLFARLADAPVPSVLWGLVYGFTWWLLGPLTLMPVTMGMGLQWTASAVAGTIPSLIWHLVFGGVMGISFAALARESVVGGRGADARAHPRAALEA